MSFSRDRKQTTPYCSIGELIWILHCAQLTSSILTTPLVALKKRGFNVDRLLNQQREQRLRSQAEATRETNTAPSTTGQQSTSISEKGAKALESSSSPSSGMITKRPESVASGSSGTGSSIMEQVAKRNPFMPSGLKGKLPNFMDSMPGAFNSKRGSSSTGASNQGNSGVTVPPVQQSSKQASHFCRYLYIH
jgi:hypothetical protein